MRRRLTQFLSVAFVCIIVNFWAYMTVCAENKGFDSMKSLYGHWQEEGYPDDVGGVYLSNEKYVVLLVDMDASRVDELKESLSDPSNVEFVNCNYSYNELKALCSQLDNHIWSSEDVCSLEVDIKGNCVSIGVNIGAVSKYKKEYTTTYGDKINVFADEQNVADKQPSNVWPLVGICAVAVVVVLAIVLS